MHPQYDMKVLQLRNTTREVTNRYFTAGVGYSIIVFIIRINNILLIPLIQFNSSGNLFNNLC